MGSDYKPINGFAQYPHMGFSLRNNPDMDIAHIIAANIETFRPAGTLKHSAKKMGISYGTLQRAAAANGNLTLDKLQILADGMRISVARLLTPPLTEYSAADPAPAQTVQEPNIREFRPPEHPAVSQVAQLMHSMTDRGKEVALEHVKLVAVEHTATKASKQQ